MVENLVRCSCRFRFHGNFKVVGLSLVDMETSDTHDPLTTVAMVTHTFLPRLVSIDTWCTTRPTRRTRGRRQVALGEWRTERRQTRATAPSTTPRE